MFPPKRTSQLRKRAIGALGLTRSFLLLEDDVDVDWEVDWNERAQAKHPHRRALRRLDRERRPGRPARPVQHCLSPVRAVRVASRPGAIGADGPRH
jgi:hypothetical protein